MPVMWFHTMCCGALVRGIAWVAGPSVLLADFILRLALPGSSKGSEVRLGCGFPSAPLPYGDQRAGLIEVNNPMAPGLWCGCAAIPH